MSFHIELVLATILAIIVIGLILLVGWPLFSIFLLAMNRTIIVYGKVRNAFPYRSPFQLINDWLDFWEKFYYNNKIERDD